MVDSPLNARGITAVVSFAAAFLVYTVAFWAPGGALTLLCVLLVPACIGAGLGAMSRRVAQGTAAGVVVGIVAGAMAIGALFLSVANSMSGAK